MAVCQFLLQQDFHTFPHAFCSFKIKKLTDVSWFRLPCSEVELSTTFQCIKYKNNFVIYEQICLSWTLSKLLQAQGCMAMESIILQGWTFITNIHSAQKFKLGYIKNNLFSIPFNGQNAQLQFFYNSEFGQIVKLQHCTDTVRLGPIFTSVFMHISFVKRRV